MKTRILPKAGRLFLAEALLAFLLPAATSAAPLPRPLYALGEAAEDAYDCAAAGKWDKAAARVGSVRDALTALPASIDTAEMKAAYGELSQALKGRDRLAALEASNELTRLSCEASRGYETRFPAEIALLDYLGRELLVKVERKDGPGAGKIVRDIRMNWDAVRPSVESHGGQAASRKFSATVKRIEDTRDLMATGPLAKGLLDQVDDLEDVYKPRKP